MNQTVFTADANPSLKASPGAYLLKSAVVGAAGGLLFGFDTAVIAGTTHQLASRFSLDSRALGITVSIALWGTVVGSLMSGFLGQKFGARSVLRYLAMCYLISALGCAFAPTWFSLVCFRFIGGLGIGGSSVIGPVYVSEIAPAHRRGRLVGLFQINIVIGILLAYLSNFLIGSWVTSLNTWRWQLGIAAVPAAFFFFFLLRIPQSPRWLIAQGRFEEAREILRQSGADAENELESIRQAINAEDENSRVPLFQWKYRLPIALALLLAAFNQLSGINAVLYYLNDIFGVAGYSAVSSGLLAVAVGAINLIATLFAMSVIDRLGRKKLLLIGSVGMAAALIGIAVLFFAHIRSIALFWLLVVFMVSFSISQGSVIWVYLSEIFPTRVRAKGQSLGTTTHWIMNAVISYLFPVLAAEGMGRPFAFFAGMMALQFVVVLFLFPETKRLSLEELDRIMVRQ